MDSSAGTTFQLQPLTLAGREELTKRLYTARELMTLTDMTRRQVEYWAEIDLLRPTFRKPHAHGRRPALFYTVSDVVRAMIICELRCRNFSLQQVRQIVRNLQEQGLDLSRSELYLLTDGHSVYYAFSDREVMDVLKQHHQMLLLLPIHEQLARLQQAA
jgi:DNA-binding transcriptional MerR regulator